MFELGSPMLPLWCLIPTTILLIGLLGYQCSRLPCQAAKLVFFACALRYIMGAYTGYTFRISPVGLSWMALASIGVIGVGILVLKKKQFFSIEFLPIAIIALLMLVSALINQGLHDAIEPILRFAFLAIIIVGISHSIKQQGTKFLHRFLYVFLPPLVFQAESLALGVAKASEADGSASYIGGYGHESAFSVILMTCFLTACFANRLHHYRKFLILLICLIGIWISNYRTTIIAMAPILIVQVGLGMPSAFKRSQRAFVTGTVIIAGIALLFAGIVLEADRFADLGTVATQGTSIIKAPESFSPEDRKFLSGRAYIWSEYIYAYMRAAPLQQVIGFGPESWSQTFDIYAHNTLISYLYELGWLGVLTLLLLWAVWFATALRVPKEVRTRVLAGHASFFILNMATMPLWQIEGNILYGILCGYTLALASRRHRNAGVGQHPAQRAFAISRQPAET